MSRPSDYHTVVREHWPKTTGILLASQHPCIGIRDTEVRHIRRLLLAAHPDDLGTLKPPPSWVMGVILCPGDSTEPLAAWARRHRADGRRVWFYLHPDAEAEALRPWRDAGFRTDQVDTVSSWQELHPLFGLALNDQVYADFSNQ
ncbi:MAG: hypothetical protein LC623_01340 [Halobacteriales archaeon]|nr:hypothetical protein [Halobacteriales archaeon]